MSYGKRVVVDEDEWLRLQQAAKQLRHLNASIPSLLDDVRRATRRDLETGFETVRTRQEQFDSSLSQLGARTSELGKQTARRLAEHARRMAEQEAELVERMARQESGLVARMDGQVSELTDRMDGQVSELTARMDGQVSGLTARMDRGFADTRAQTRALVEAEHRWAQEIIAAETEERRREIGAVKAELGSMRENRSRAEAHARGALTEADRVAAHIRRFLPHERFAAGQLAEHEARSDQARAQLEAGFVEAAVSTADESRLRLHELRVLLELRDGEWRRARDSAEHALGHFLASLEGNRVRTVPVEGATGEESDDDVDVDVDLWSHGSLRVLEDEVRALLARVTGAAHADPVPGVSELRGITGELPRLQAHLEDICELAGRELLASQRRYEVADAAVDFLVSNGYRPVGSTYEGQDERQGFVAKVAHEDGSEIVVTVAATRPDAPPALDLETFNDPDGAEQSRVERIGALLRELESEGITTGPVQRTGQPAPARADLTRTAAGPGTASGARQPLRLNPPAGAEAASADGGR
ncbi:hypothetical protein AB0O01_35135 [Streptomyces sp. NPDC093252]|uniref:hypothetical protein n=1 Tax=Streptomyces sp. NPDC093252 TaxID=3154980 RepID=UPI003447BFAB